MARQKCVITDYMGDDIAEESAMLEAAGIEAFLAPSPDPRDWLEEAADAQAILTRHAKIGKEVISTLSECRIIARYGTGFDNIDVDSARSKGIQVTVVTDYATDEVADHTMALILGLVRAIPAFVRATVKGGWTPNPLPPIPAMSDITLGLVGAGRIAQAVAKRARAFGTHVMGYDPYVAELPPDIELVATLPGLLEKSNVLSLHAPLSETTRGLIDRDAMRRLPAGAYVVNVARGGLLDLDAAIDLVDEAHLAGLGLDVVDVEPLPANHPARTHERVVLTPHVGYYSTSSVLRAKRTAVGNIVRTLLDSSGSAPV